MREIQRRQAVRIWTSKVNTEMSTDEILELIAFHMNITTDEVLDLLLTGEDQIRYVGQNKD